MWLSVPTKRFTIYVFAENLWVKKFLGVIVFAVALLFWPWL